MYNGYCLTTTILIYVFIFFFFWIFWFFSFFVFGSWNIRVIWDSMKVDFVNNRYYLIFIIFIKCNSIDNLIFIFFSIKFLNFEFNICKIIFCVWRIVDFFLFVEFFFFCIFLNMGVFFNIFGNIKNLILLFFR